MRAQQILVVERYLVEIGKIGGAVAPWCSNKANSRLRSSRVLWVSSYLQLYIATVIPCSVQVANQHVPCTTIITCVYVALTNMA